MLSQGAGSYRVDRLTINHVSSSKLLKACHKSTGVVLNVHGLLFMKMLLCIKTIDLITKYSIGL